MGRQTRKFEDEAAARDCAQPLILGIMGPSGGGKTFSALRFASGIQRVSGGEVFLIDTENKRCLAYADNFRFRRVFLDPPFDPLSYLDAVEHCVRRGAGVIIIDSMSHEHEGEGGLHDAHDAECERLMRAWRTDSREKVQFSAWGPPKRARRRMINAFTRLNTHLILTFRADEKSKPVKKEERGVVGAVRRAVGAGGRETIVNQGYVPIAGKSLVYEMTACALLLPNAGGVPTWDSELGEREMIKRPQQFLDILSGNGPLNEEMGEAMARWAAGNSNQAHAELVAAITDATSKEALEALIPRLTAAKDGKLVSPAEYQSLRELYGARKRLLASTAERSEPRNEEPESWGDVTAPDDGERDPNNPEDY